MSGPQIEDSKTLVREDTPWYISAAFPKIFQTGEGDYWAFEKLRKARGQPVSLHRWVQHVLRGRDGRALRHPRFYYFALNTVLRNKAVRGRSYFIKKGIGNEAYTQCAPRDLLNVGKAKMMRVLCAYEQNLPGSASEKLSQRADLESMLNHIEEETFEKATSRMPALHSALVEATKGAQAWLRQ